MEWYFEARRGCDRAGVEFEGLEGEILLYRNGKGDIHKAKQRLYKWARGLHGNAPSGTPYAYYVVKRYDGTTRRVRLYV